MAIDLLNSFLQRGQNLSSKQSGNKGQISQQAVQSTPHNMQVMRAMRALQAGSTLQGEVVSVKGDEVQLAIMKDLIIDARLAQSMNLTPGMTMAFQVKSNNSQELSLIPLFTNTSVDPNAVKALEMAGISVNERSLEMVQSMMEKGMSIDKQSIQEIYRDIVGFKDATVNEIVSLHQMKLPVTQENLTQISMYQNNRHYLADSFSQIGESIGKQLELLVDQGNGKEAVHLLRQLSAFFESIKGNADHPGQPAGDVSVGEEALPLKDNSKTAILSQEVLPNEVPSKEQEGLEIKMTNTPVGEEKELTEKNGQSVEQSGNNSQISENDKEWKLLNQLILKGDTSGRISKIFERIWGKEIGKQWLLEPEMVQDKEKVLTYFEKLGRQVKQLEGIFEQGSLAKGETAKVLQNTTANLDFMNQLNQMHAYIQLPLKMLNQKAHGELYVFTNKKTLNQKEGKVTALLHLNMENLGNMDVYVEMEDKKVNTKFYLEKEEYLDFLEAHMELLTARINKRGYSCEIKTSLRVPEENESMMKIMESEQNKPVLLSMQAFDMRA